MSKRFVAMLMGAAALAVIVAGCGGGDDDQASLTKAQYVKRGTAICAKGVERIGAKFQVYLKDHEEAKGKAAREAQAAEVSEEILLPGYQAEVDELRDLPAPEGEEDQVAEMLDTLEAGLEEMGSELTGLYEAGDDSQLARGLKTANEYGLVGCLQLF